MTGVLGRRRRRSAVVAIAIVGLLLAVSVVAFTSPAPSGEATAAVAPTSIMPGPAASELPVTGASTAGGEVPLSSSSAGSVVRTVYLNYNTSTTGNFPSAVWDWRAGGGVVDPTTGDVWIPEWPVSVQGIRLPESAPALVFDPSTNATGTEPALANASALAYDPIDGYLYATRPLANDVVAFDPVSDAIVGAPIPVGGDPVAILYDPVSANLFVANNGTSNVTVINGTNGHVVDKGVSVGSHPITMADDTRSGKLFVADSSSLEISVVNTSTLILGSPIPTSSEPTNLAYSNSSNVLAVGMEASVTMILYNATSQAVTSLATIGAGITSLITTLNGGYFVVANGTGSSLLTVLASTAAIATFGPTLPTGSYPSRLTTGASDDTLFAWSAVKRALSEVNLTAQTDQEISPDLGAEGISLAYDPGSDRVFVSDSTNSSVVVLNASTFSSVSNPIWLAAPALSIVDDASAGAVFVGYDGGVSEINAESGRVIASVDGGNASGNNSELLVDAASGRLWDVNQVHGLESFALSDLRSFGAVGADVGVRELLGMALDPTTGGLFVVNVTASTLTEFNGTTGVAIGSTSSAIPGLVSVAYDSADQELYALGRDLWVVSPQNHSVVAGPIAIAPHTVAWSVVYDPSREYLYIPSNDSLNSAWPGNVTVIDGASVSASEGSYVSLPVGQLPVAVASVELPGSNAPGSSEIWVANYVSGTVSVVASPPSVSYFAADPNPVDVGASTTFELGVVGGAGPSTVTYAGLPQGCASTDETSITCAPQSTGSFSVSAIIADSLGETVTANTTLSVSPAIQLQVTVDSTPTGEIDLNQSFEATASASGGTAPYNYSWSFGDGSVGWGATATHVFDSPGSYFVSVIATDAGGGVSSNTTRVVVEPSASLALVASPSNVTDVGVGIELAATVSGGTTPGVGVWDLGNGVNESGTNVRYAYNTSGVYFATFEYRDASGVATSQYLRVVVNPVPSARWSVTAVPAGSGITVGTELDFNATISGGTAPYTVVWSFDDGSYAYGISAEHDYASAGTYTVTLFIEDAAGGSWNGTYRLVVAAGPSSSGGGLPFASGVLLGIFVGAALAAALLLLAVRPRRRPPAAAPAPYIPPTASDEGPPWKES